jgi:S-formylglutathione hydrolase FrmB
MGHVSLMDGWLPVALQAVTALALVAAVGWSPTWSRARWTPLLLMVGVGTAVAVRWWFELLGLASEPAPVALWVWSGLTATAVGGALIGWRSAKWFRRNVTAFAASLCLLSVGVTINTWIGYFPTVGNAWNQLTAGPLPDELDWAAVEALPRGGDPPRTGALLSVDTGSDASGFGHRDEYVYLPPAWFISDPPPRLSAVMMIGGQFNTPADWVRAGDAVNALDVFAAQHGGYAPVAVFVDSTGSFANDTECVNGPRGNAADHLTKDVVPYVTRTFRIDGESARWAVAGFSSGGTCAVDLAVMHPESFGAFLDIAGDLGPNTGTKAQTIDRLYGGDEQAWSTFDPATAITRYGRYADLSGRFIVPAPTKPDAGGYGRSATTLCELGASHGISCEVVARPGRHVWPFAATAFAESLPWLAAELSVERARCDET